MDVLDGLDRGADFDIYVTVVPCRQIRVIRDDAAVVKGVAFAICISPAILRPSIFWIAILSKAGFRTKLLWIMLAALALYHARSISVFITAKTMHHALCDIGVEHGMSNRIRDLGRNDGVNMSGITDFERPSQKEEEMDVGQSTLLKLDGEDKAKDVTEQTTL